VGRLRTVAARMATADTSAARVPDKVPDAFYRSSEWQATRARILKRDKGRCQRCGGRAGIVDHIVARRDGGTDADDNLRSLCRTCDNVLKEDHLGRRRGGG
jgi:5-methylcytosine-specific restriction endonuclease McrA